MKAKVYSSINVGGKTGFSANCRTAVVSSSTKLHQMITTAVTLTLLTLFKLQWH